MPYKMKSKTIKEKAAAGARPAGPGDRLASLHSIDGTLRGNEIADLAAERRAGLPHAAEALQYRLAGFGAPGEAT